MQIRKHEIIMVFVFFLVCDQYIQRYLYHVATITESSALWGSIRWNGILYYFIFITGLLAIYVYIRKKSYQDWLKKLPMFISISLFVKFILDKILTNLLQIDPVYKKLLLPYHLYFFLEWLYFIFLVLLIFFVFDNNSLKISKFCLSTAAFILISLVVVSIIIYWEETLNLELLGQSVFFSNSELSYNSKQTVFNAIQQKIFTIIICPSLLILCFKFTNPKLEGRENG